MDNNLTFQVNAAVLDCESFSSAIRDEDNRVSLANWMGSGLITVIAALAAKFFDLPEMIWFLAVAGAVIFVGTMASLMRALIRHCDRILVLREDNLTINPEQKQVLWSPVGVEEGVQVPLYKSGYSMYKTHYEGSTGYVFTGKPDREFLELIKSHFQEKERELMYGIPTVRICIMPDANGADTERILESLYQSNAKA